MKVLVACEYSGRVRDAFRAKGHDAWSCDLLPCEDDSRYHIHGDVRNELQPNRWDMLIAHPDCTYLTNSAAWALKDGPYHQNVKPGTLVGAARRQAQAEALDFVRLLFDAPIEKKCLENPIGKIGTAIRKHTQIIQPWQFGHDANKATCLWLENLPLLVPTKIIGGRVVEWPRGSGKFVERWSNQTDSGQNNLTPSDDRWKDRARTYQGWADAMADQWG
ncbi:MAG: hypothetical protein EBR90_02020 [Actinobacteria bacterium]|nr:hypothetical protein [Actinomycetota bacterium]